MVSGRLGWSITDRCLGGNGVHFFLASPSQNAQFSLEFFFFCFLVSCFNLLAFGSCCLRHITESSLHTEWPGFVSTQMLIWRTFNLAWALDRTPLHVLVYHRMEAQLAPELRHVIRFLNETSISPRVDCAVRAREAHARRKKPDWQRKAAVFSDCLLYTSDAADDC